MTLKDNQPVELKDFLKGIGKYVKFSFIFCCAVAIIAFTFALKTGSKFTASGTLFVKRQVDTNVSYFTYEGYYSALTSEKYTDSVMALAKSYDVLKAALGKLKLSATPAQLASVEGSIVARRVGPQLVSLSVSGDSRKFAGDLWLSLSDSLIQKSGKLNVEGGDNQLSITAVDQSPVIQETKANPLLYALVAFGVSLIILVSVLSFIDYWRK